MTNGRASSDMPDGVGMRELSVNQSNSAAPRGRGLSEVYLPSILRLDFAVFLAFGIAIGGFVSSVFAQTDSTAQTAQVTESTERTDEQEASRATDGRLPSSLSAEEKEKQLKLARQISSRTVQLMRTGKRREAVSYAQQAARIRCGILGQEHPDSAHSLFLLAQAYQANADYDKAEKVYLRILQIAKKIFGEKHENYATTLNDLGSLYRATGQCAKAVTLLEKACEILRQLRGQDNASYAAYLGNLAGAYNDMGELGKAGSLYAQAHDICLRTLDPKHTAYARSVNNLARFYKSAGRYADAEPLYLESADLCRRTAGEDHPNYAICIHNLARLYLDMGQHIKAETLFRKAIDVSRKALGESHPHYASFLSSLGELYESMGEYAKAEPYYAEAVAIRKKTLGETHPDYAESLNDLAVLYKNTGRIAEAETLYLEALKIKQDALGVDHPSFALSLTNLAKLYRSTDQYEKAEPLLRKASEIFREKYGENHPKYAWSIVSLAGLYQLAGEYSKAQPLYAEAAELRKRAYGDDHSMYASSLQCLASLSHAQGAESRAVDFGLRAEQIRQNVARDFFAAYSEAESLNFAAKNLNTPHVLLSAWQRTNLPAEEVYEILWSRRGLIQRVIAERQRLLQRMQSQEVRNVYAQYLSTRRELVTAVLPSAASYLPSDRRDRIRRLTDRKEELERQLSNEIPEIEQRIERLRRPHTDLLRCLPPGAVFVDFIRYRDIRHDPSAPRDARTHHTISYAAFVMARGTGVVHVALGEASPIDEAVARWRESIFRGRSESDAETLRRLIWVPLVEHLPSEVNTIYICPDGRLTALPWAALPIGDRRILLEDYAVAAVPHGQFLLAQLSGDAPSAAIGGGTILAVGDVVYDRFPDDSSSNRESSQAQASSTIEGEARLEWSALPGTRDELAALSTAAANRPVQKLVGTAASTDRALAELPQARWAHFATHGFFADVKFRSVLQVDPAIFEEEEDRGTGERSSIAGRNPLLLSGLVMAGASLPAERDEYGLPRSDGGILTAETIAGLPLERLDLVVLSACETGLGEVAGGEGVFGLQRAFHVAGARNVVASLWKVDDQATAALMSLFYDKLWRERKSPIAALREAQLAVYRDAELGRRIAIDRGFAIGKPTLLPDDGQAPSGVQHAPTRHWASFVLSGSGA